MGGFRRYGQAVRRLLPPVMQASEQRVKAQVKAGTPVDSGHMRDNLLSTSDIAEVEDQYAVFWRSQEFLGERNAKGKVITTFYPPIVLLHTDPMTPAIEAERPILHAEVVQMLEQAARTVAR